MGRINGRALLSVISVLLWMHFSSAQPPDTLWTRTYGYATDDFCMSGQQTFDGGYIATGEVAVPGRDWNGYLLKTDSLGDSLWMKLYDWGSGHDVLQTSDSGYIVVLIAPGPDISLMKTDRYGDSLWTRTYSSPSHEWVNAVEKTADGGYIIVGEIGPMGAADVYLIKADSLGDTVWTRTYGGAANDVGIAVKQTIDSGYIVVGRTRSFGAGLGDIYLIKTDADGDSLWTKTYGGTDEESGDDICLTANGGYIVAGSSRSFGAGGNDAWLINTDSLGDSLWAKTYGSSGFECCYSVTPVFDGYVLAGAANSNGDLDVWLLKIDTGGDTLWTSTYGGTKDDWTQVVRRTSDEGYILFGQTRSFGAGMLDIYLIKIAPDVIVDSTWPMFHHDPLHTGLSPLTGDMDTCYILWSFQTGNAVNSSPALGDVDCDGNLEVVVGAFDGGIYALNGEDGTCLWSHFTSAGVNSSPALGDVDGDDSLEVVVGSRDYSIYALNGADGSVLWSFPTGHFVDASPVFGDVDCDGTLEVIIGSNDGNIYALNGEDGGLLWSYQAGYGVWSSAALADLDNDDSLEVIVGSGGYLYALNAENGSLLWSFPITILISSPALGDVDCDGNLEVVVGSLDGSIYVLNGEDGSFIWSFPTGNMVLSSPALGDIDDDDSLEVVFMGYLSTVFALNGGDGSLCWSYVTPGSLILHPSPALGDVDGDGSLEVVVGGSYYSLYALNGENGSVLWSYPTYGVIESSAALGDVDADGYLEIVVGSSDHTIYALNGQPSMVGEHISSQSMFADLHIRPNPFCDKVTFDFSRICKAEDIKLKIYDAMGKMVKEFLQLNDQQIKWNGTGEGDRKLPSGVYFLKIDAGDCTATRKLLLIR